LNGSAAVRQPRWNSLENEMRFVCLLSTALLAMVTTSAFAQEKVDNAEFATWKKFKKGTSITLKITSTVAGMSSEVTTTTTLVEVADDKVVIESSGVTKAGGMEFPIPASKRDVPKTIVIQKGEQGPGAVAPKPEGTYEEGTETVKIA